MKFNKVVSFVQFLIGLGGVYSYDGENYIISKDDEGERISVAVAKEPKSLLIIQESMTDNDALVLNPLNEAIGDREDARWLYASFSIGLSRRLITLVDYIKAMKDLSDSDDEIPTDALKLISKYGTDMDDKFEKEFHRIVQNPLEFMNVFYNRKIKKARFRCCVFEETSKKKFPGVRKKTWAILDALFTDLFGLTTDEKEDEIGEKFSSKSTMITCPKLHSMLTVYLKIFEQINEYMLVIEDIDQDFVVDLTELGVHLNNLSDYYDKVKWFVQSSTTAVKEEELSPLAPTSLHTEIPLDTSIVSSSVPNIIETAPGFTTMHSSVPHVIENGGFNFNTPNAGAPVYPMNQNNGFINQPVMNNNMGMVSTGIPHVVEPGYM